MRHTVIAALLGLLWPVATHGGVTLHYSGTALTDNDVAGALADTVAFAKAHGWPFEQRVGSVTVRPHAWCDPVELTFDARKLARSFVKTQFAGPETHIAVVELFRTMRPRFEVLAIEDEGGYWESSDREKLIARMQSDGLMMVRLEQQNPGSRGPYVLPTGHIVDIAVAPHPGAAPQVAAELEAAGAKPLAAPLVPARPWVPKVKTIPRLPPDRWRSFGGADVGFTVSLPADPEVRSRPGGYVSYRSRSGGAAFLVQAGPPVTGEDRVKVLADFAPAFAQHYVGRIVSDVRRIRDGTSQRTLTVVEGEELVHHRVVVGRDNSWVLTVAARGARPAEEDVQAFFDSFRPAESLGQE